MRLREDVGFGTVALLFCSFKTMGNEKIDGGGKLLNPRNTSIVAIVVAVAALVSAVIGSSRVAELEKQNAELIEIIDGTQKRVREIGLNSNNLFLLGRVNYLEEAVETLNGKLVEPTGLNTALTNLNQIPFEPPPFDPRDGGACKSGEEEVVIVDPFVGHVPYFILQPPWDPLLGVPVYGPNPLWRALQQDPCILDPSLCLPQQELIIK